MPLLSLGRGLSNQNPWMLDLWNLNEGSEIGDSFAPLRLILGY